MLHTLDDDGGTAYSGVVNKLYNKDLETVLNYIKELEKGITRLKDKNKKLSEEIIDVKVDKVKRNFIPKQEHKEKIKELEKERDGIYADYQDLGKAYYDSIPKQKIRDKILYYKSWGIDMNKNLAEYLTVLIANDLKHTRDISSGTCEMIEKYFINGEFEKIEEYIRNFINDKRTVAEIVSESEE